MAGAEHGVQERVPPPALEPDGQAALPWRIERVRPCSALKPLVELQVLGEGDLIVLAVVAVWLFLTVRLSFEFFGFFFVPAFVGVSLRGRRRGGGRLGDGDGRHGE